MAAAANKRGRIELYYRSENITEALESINARKNAERLKAELMLRQL